MKNNVIEVKDFEVLESDENMEENNTNENKINQDNVLAVIEQATDELDENDHTTDEKGRWYEWSVDSTTVRSLLKRQKEGKLKLPFCQRLYVWDIKQRSRLFQSVLSNIPCGVLMLAEVNGVQYLVDGLQRLTSLMYLSIDYDKMNITKDQKKVVLDYRVATIVVKDTNANDTKELFNLYNSGIPLAAAVKYRSTLSDELNNAILSLSSNEFFRDIKTKVTFKKGHHHELIAENALLAASGMEFDSNKAKDVCSKLKDNEQDVLDNMEKAKNIIDRIISVFSSGIDDDVVSRSFNANYVCPLCYIISKYPNYTDDNIREMTEYIFADKVAIKAYTTTTSNGASDPTKCKNRFKLLESLLSNPPAKTVDDKFNKEKFNKWVSEQEVIKDTDKKYVTDIHDYGSDELRMLYMAYVHGKAKEWNAVVEKVYKRMEESEDADN